MHIYREDLYDVPQPASTKNELPMPEGPAPARPPKSANLISPDTRAFQQKNEPVMQQNETPVYTDGEEEEEEMVYINNPQSPQIQDLDAIYDIPKSMNIAPPEPCAGPNSIHRYINAASQPVVHRTEPERSSGVPILTASALNEPVVVSVYDNNMQQGYMPMNGSYTPMSRPESNDCRLSEIEGEMDDIYDVPGSNRPVFSSRPSRGDNSEWETEPVKPPRPTKPSSLTSGKMAHEDY